MLFTGYKRFLYLTAASHLEEGRYLYYYRPVLLSFMGNYKHLAVVLHHWGLCEGSRVCGRSVALVSGKALNSQDATRHSQTRVKNEITWGKVGSSRQFMKVWLQERSSPGSKPLWMGQQTLLCVCSIFKSMKQNTPSASLHPEQFIQSQSFGLRLKAFYVTLFSSGLGLKEHWERFKTTSFTRKYKLPALRHL